MTNLAKWFLLLFGGAVILVLSAVCTLEKVPPATIAVRQALWGGGGVEANDYSMGFHLGITGYHKWHLLDKRTHFLTFSEDGKSSGVGTLRPPLVIRTKDNNTANFDLTVTYRIIPGKGHELVRKGLKEIYRERVFKTVESVMREELAQLSSEDIYLTAERIRVTQAALPKLEQELENFYVRPDQILIRAIRFTDAYERKLS